jgi:hypothetical protein
VFVTADRSGTDPLLPDTDGGGVEDGLEVQYGRDPNDADDEPQVVQDEIIVEDGVGRSWRIRSDASLGESSDDPLINAFTDAGGFQVLVGNRPFPDLGSFLQATPGRDFRFGPTGVSGVSVSRAVLVQRELGFIRYIETLENSSDDSVVVSVSLRHEFYHSPWVVVDDTSSGDELWTVEDDFVHFGDRDPGDGMPAFLWIYSDPNRPTAGITPAEMFFDGAVGAHVAFEVEIPAGERRAILHVGAMRTDLDASRALAMEMAGNLVSLSEGLTLEEESSVVNFALDRDGDMMSTRFDLLHGLDPESPRMLPWISTTMA